MDVCNCTVYSFSIKMPKVASVMRNRGLVVKKLKEKSHNVLFIIYCVT